MKKPFYSIIIPSIVLFSGCGGGQISETISPARVEVESIEIGAISPTGVLVVDVQDILGVHREARLILRNFAGEELQRILAPAGIGQGIVDVGTYSAHIEVYDASVPLVVSIQSVEIFEGEKAEISYELLLGVAGGRSLMAFDQDNDLILDAVELEQGTDPHDAVSRPGATPFHWPEQFLDNEEGWLRGELHAHSSHGVGTESVSTVIARAEKLDLDFLSILDRNTLAPALDESYRSNRLIMIPGMEWGTKESGVALVYTPGSMPSLPRSEEEMSIYTRLIQAQGGLVFAAHPCYPTSPWNWGGDYLNGVQAWCMNWRAMPPMGMNLVHEHNRLRKDDRYVSSLARVANLPGLSANGQATAFWDFEMRNGRQLTLIGGSQSGSPKVPMAEPVTYVYAKENSLAGIMEGLRLGRTYVSKGLKGPQIEWVGDIFDDGSIDVSIGGTVPLDHPTRYWVHVKGAKDSKLEIVLNGVASRSVPILMDDWVFSYVQNPGHLAVFKIRVVDNPEEMGFGLREVLAMTSPIFANGIVQTDDVEGENGWIKINNEYMAPSRIDDFINYLEDNFKSSN